MPKLLQEPWNKGRRISSPRKISSLWESCDSGKTGGSENKGCWASVPGSRKKEFERLKTDEEIAIWICDQHPDIRIHKEGKRFLEKTIQRYAQESDFLDTAGLTQQESKLKEGVWA